MSSVDDSTANAAITDYASAMPVGIAGLRHGSTLKIKPFAKPTLFVWKNRSIVYH